MGSQSLTWTRFGRNMYKEHPIPILARTKITESLRHRQARPSAALHRCGPNVSATAFNSASVPRSRFANSAMRCRSGVQCNAPCSADDINECNAHKDPWVCNTPCRPQMCAPGPRVHAMCAPGQHQPSRSERPGHKSEDTIKRFPSPRRTQSTWALLVRF